ncbi:uncharacterized protein LOC126293354 isoform X2 [Schistocerca gregaria]|uniref:uncharacterized protein LOC126293354 isoform X2 n=1 Tax=Schistocerca gregaria TaxID=7010 RepID=UPI00211E770E|nr:uncharacterized protein LOC126293354 isoform X2 [Schistocerca gregaria]XP_049842514.1 uncharacterized protein LOC126293354 isoform X2 [Schistocerca gregaria]
MQHVKHFNLPHPLSVHLEPEEALNSSVTVEFSVEEIPSMRDPKVRNTKTTNKQQEDITWSKKSGQTEAPYNPFVLWDVIPRLLNDVINGAGLKVQSMDDKKQTSAVGNLPVSSTLHDDPDSGFPVMGAGQQWNETPSVNEGNEPIYAQRDRPTLIFPRITGLENGGESSDELSMSNDPFEKKEWQTVGNIVNPNKPVGTPVIIDNIRTRSSEALLDAADVVTQRKWERRPAYRGKLMPAVLNPWAAPENAISKDDRVSTVLSAYTKSVPLQRRREEDPSKKDADAVSVSISETDTGDIEVDLSEADVNNISGSSEEVISYADVACGTDGLQRDASQCILCGSLLHHRHHDQRTHYSKDAPAIAQPSRAMEDASTRTSAAEYTHKARHKSVRRESTAHPVTNDGGQAPRAMTDASTHIPIAEHIQAPKMKTTRKEGTAHHATNNRGQSSRAPVDVSTQALGAGHTQHSKEKTMRQEVTAYPVASSPGQLPKAMFAPSHASTAEHKQHPIEKHAREVITAHPVMTYPSRLSGTTMDAGTSTAAETQNPGMNNSEKPKTFVNDENVAVYPMSRATSSFFRRSSKANKDDKPNKGDTQCTMQHIVFPRDNCPYSPSLTSLPLDESDIEYIIRRAQLAKAVLPADESLCPVERWQLRTHHRHSSRSGRSRSSG